MNNNLFFGLRDETKCQAHGSGFEGQNSRDKADNQQIITGVNVRVHKHFQLRAKLWSVKASMGSHTVFSLEVLQ